MGSLPGEVCTTREPEEGPLFFSAGDHKLGIMMSSFNQRKSNWHLSEYTYTYTYTVYPVLACAMRGQIICQGVSRYIQRYVCTQFSFLFFFGKSKILIKTDLAILICMPKHFFPKFSKVNIARVFRPPSWLLEGSYLNGMLLVKGQQAYKYAMKVSYHPSHSRAKTRGTGYEPDPGIWILIITPSLLITTTHICDE